MYGRPYKDKAEADKWAEELNAAVAALQTILDDNLQTGTGFTKSNILNNALEWLNAPERSGYPYLASSQPLIQGKTYEFPQYATDIVIDGKGNKADIELRWVDNNKNVIITGNTLTIAECEEPHNQSFTAMAAGYKDPVTGAWVELNQQIDAYNNCLIGAPVSRDDQYPVNIPELTAGMENVNTRISVPLKGKQRVIDNISSVAEIKIVCIDSTPLLRNLRVTRVYTAQNVPGFDIEADTMQLSAADPTEGNGRKKATVQLSIPKDTVTLTDWAIEDGWYVPENGLVLTADVWVCSPTA